MAVKFSEFSVGTIGASLEIVGFDSVTPQNVQVSYDDVKTDILADAGTVTSVATTAPITGGTITGIGTIGITQATSSIDGYLSATDWSTFNGKQNSLISLNRQTASYILALADRGKLVEMNVATANNLTVPLDSSVAFPIGTQINFSQYGAGQTTVVATSGVTVRSAGGALKLALQYSGGSLVKIGTNEWYLFGDITV